MAGPAITVEQAEEQRRAGVREEVPREPSSYGRYRPPLRNTETLDLSRMFADQGMEFQGVDEKTGNPIVRDRADGSTGTLDLDRMLADEGLDRARLNLQYNTPSTALNEAPPDMGFRPAFRNEKGFVSHLKKSYEDVQVDPDKGIVVKKNGTYYRADPGGMANLNPWELSRELVENLDIAVDTGLQTAGGVIGGIAGSVVPGAGTVAGAMAGRIAGQAASTYVKTSLGRIWGTYEATDEERLGDIALETALAAGGYGLAAGAKAIAPKVVSTLKRIAGSPAREAWTNLVGFLTKSGTQAAETMVDQPGRVAQTIRSAYDELGERATKDAAVELLASKKADAATQMLDEATKALPRKYVQGLKALGAAAETKQTSVPFDNVVDTLSQTIESTRFGRYVTTGTKAGSAAEQIAGAPTRALRRFVPFSIEERAAAGLPYVPEDAMQAISSLANKIEHYRAGGALKGERAVEMLAELNRVINATGREVQKSPTAAAFMAEVGKLERAAVGQMFADAGLGEQWVKVNAPYIRYSDAVESAKKLLNSQEGVYTFADKLTRVAGKRGSATGVAQDLVELLGPRGQELYDKILVTNAAMKFAPSAPQLGFAQVAATTTAGAAGALAGPAGAGAVLGVGLPLSSPRLALRATQGAEWAGKLVPQAQNVLEFVKGQPESFRRALLTNPEALNVMTRSMIEGAVGEERLRDGLLHDAGAK